MSSNILGPRGTVAPLNVGGVLSGYEFVHSIDGPCWLFGAFCPVSKVTNGITNLYGNTVCTYGSAEDTVKSMPDNLFQSLTGSYRFPIGFATDGVTIEAYGGFDVANVGAGALGMDTPSYGPIVSRFGRIAVHAHMNIFSKRASTFFKRLFGLFGQENAVPSYVFGNQLLDSSDSDNFIMLTGNMVGAIVASSTMSLYSTHNVLSPDGLYMPVLVVKQTMTKRGQAAAMPSLLFSRLLMTVHDADLILFNVYPADPYIAFVGQQPSFIEAKLICFGVPLEPTPVALGRIVQQDDAEQDDRSRSRLGVPSDLPNKQAASVMHYYPSVMLGDNVVTRNVVVKMHCGNSPNAITITQERALHFFGWSSQRIGSMV